MNNFAQIKICAVITSALFRKLYTALIRDAMLVPF